jgi:ribosome modulation factor
MEFKEGYLAGFSGGLTQECPYSHRQGIKRSRWMAGIDYGYYDKVNNKPNCFEPVLINW